MGGLAIRYFIINFIQSWYHGWIGYNKLQNSSVLSPMTTARKVTPSKDPVECGEASHLGEGIYNRHWWKGNSFYWLCWLCRASSECRQLYHYHDRSMANILVFSQIAMHIDAYKINDTFRYSYNNIQYLEAKSDQWDSLWPESSDCLLYSTLTSLHQVRISLAVET